MLSTALTGIILAREATDAGIISSSTEINPGMQPHPRLDSPPDKIMASVFPYLLTRDASCLAICKNCCARMPSGCTSASGIFLVIEK